MVDTPSGPPDIPTDEELEKMSLSSYRRCKNSVLGRSLVLPLSNPVISPTRQLRQ